MSEQRQQDHERMLMPFLYAVGAAGTFTYLFHAGNIYDHPIATFLSVFLSLLSVIHPLVAIANRQK